MPSSLTSEIKIFPELESLSRQAARMFEGEAGRCVREKGVFTAALSGGSTPKRLYQILANPEHQIDWEHVHLFQVDERCVPPDHAESNYKMTREALLDHVKIPASNFHRIQAESADRDAASRKYAQEMAQVLKPAAGKFPRLDLIFLGMGSDGHTASLFPGSAALNQTTLWVCPNFSERLKSFRLTMTYPVLNSAARVVFLVAGEDKAEALHKVMNGPSRLQELPAQGIRPTDGMLSWYLDEAAARLLPR